MASESESIAGDNLEGEIAVRFQPGKTFNEYCAKHIANYDAARFEVLAVRFFYGKEIDITVYAADKDRQEQSGDDTVPVHKFRLPTAFLKDILLYIDECNFTITSGAYPLEKMRVINK
jgi:hypothetical protein